MYKAEPIACDICVVLFCLRFVHLHYVIEIFCLSSDPINPKTKTSFSNFISIQISFQFESSFS